MSIGMFKNINETVRDDNFSKPVQFFENCQYYGDQIREHGSRRFYFQRITRKVHFLRLTFCYCPC